MEIICLNLRAVINFMDVNEDIKDNEDDNKNNDIVIDNNDDESIKIVIENE